MDEKELQAVFKRVDEHGKVKNRGSKYHGSPEKRAKDISKALSRLLRHQALNAGIPLDTEGYADLEKVVSWPPLKSLGVMWMDIYVAVNENEKQRFALKPSNQSTDPESQDFADWLIRANQGHSIKLESDSHLQPIKLDSTHNIPDVAVHGTYCALWPAIVKSGGLKSMGRNHIHFATGLPDGSQEGVVSGMRADSDLLIYADLEASLKDGAMKWWLSDNGVLLTEGDQDGLVPLKYFKLVVGRKYGIGTLWANGEWKMDLPTDVSWANPQGRGFPKSRRNK